jgi:hypothetical protein
MVVLIDDAAVGHVDREELAAVTAGANALGSGWCGVRELLEGVEGQAGGAELMAAIPG